MICLEASKISTMSGLSIVVAAVLKELQLPPLVDFQLPSLVPLLTGQRRWS